MADSNYEIVTPGAEWPHWASIAKLFSEQYEYYEQCGYAFGLRSDGVDVWLRRVTNRNPRARFFAAAVDKDLNAPVGFVEACWFLAPAYAAIRTMGRIDHIWVDPPRRGGTVARDMLNHAEAWLAEHTTVLWHEAFDTNLAGTRFWEKSGYTRRYALFEKVIGKDGADGAKK